MQTSTLITMIAITGFIWGGFALLVSVALRSERRKHSGEKQRAE